MEIVSVAQGSMTDRSGRPGGCAAVLLIGACLAVPNVSFGFPPRASAHPASDGSVAGTQRIQVSLEALKEEAPLQGGHPKGPVTGPVASAAAARRIAEKWLADGNRNETYDRIEVTRQVTGFWEVMLHFRTGGMQQMLIDRKTGQIVFAND